MFKPSQFPKNVIHIIETLKESGFNAYAVGGCTRDLLLGKTPAEWDLTTDATPEEVTKLFEKVVPTGIKYGTVTVLLNDDQYEVTTFRSEMEYSDGRRPDRVIFSKDINIDLSRRDFTINAIAYDPVSNNLIDNYEGEKDLKNKIIRTVGEPILRFNEDGLRSIRACRFAAVLEFKIEPDSFSAIKKTLKNTQKVAPERIRDEIIKTMKAKRPSIAIEYMRDAGLLELIIPELICCYGVSQPEPFHKYDVYWHSLKSCDGATADNYIVRLAALLHDISKPQCKVEHTFYGHDQKGAESTESILKRLKFSNEEISIIANLIKNHMFNYTGQWTDAAVRRFIRRVGKPNLENLFLLRNADVAGMDKDIDNTYLVELKHRIKKILDEENCLEVTDLAIDGRDVMELLNIAPGKKVGETLNHLLEKVLDDPSLNTKETLSKMAKEYEG